MSGIDKDSKAKVSAPSDKKFLLGFTDGFISNEAAAVIFLTKVIRQSK